MNRLHEMASRAQSIAKYALDLRLQNSTLTVGECFNIAEEMHEKADAYLRESTRIPSNLSVGDIVKCINNEVEDEEFRQCENLELFREYKVTSIGGTGMVRLDCAVSGLIDGSFYPDRFELITQAAVVAE